MIALIKSVSFQNPVNISWDLLSLSYTHTAYTHTQTQTQTQTHMFFSCQMLFFPLLLLLLLLRLKLCCCCCCCYSYYCASTAQKKDPKRQMRWLMLFGVLRRLWGEGEAGKQNDFFPFKCSFHIISRFGSIRWCLCPENVDYGGVVHSFFCCFVWCYISTKVIIFFSWLCYYYCFFFVFFSSAFAHTRSPLWNYVMVVACARICNVSLLAHWYIISDFFLRTIIN